MPRKKNGVQNVCVCVSRVGEGNKMKPELFRYL